MSGNFRWYYRVSLANNIYFILSQYKGEQAGENGQAQSKIC